MRVFSPIAAVAVGLANALVYNPLGESPWGGPIVRKIQTGPLLTARMLSAVPAGLIVCGAAPVRGYQVPGGFFGRYPLTCAAICCGGAILSVFWHGSIILLDEREPTPQGLELLSEVAFTAAAGDIFGIFKGACPGVHLA